MHGEKGVPSVSTAYSRSSQAIRARRKLGKYQSTDCLGCLILGHINMTLPKIAWRSIQQRSLASFLTALSMALGVSLVVAVLVIGQIVEKSFASGNALGYNLIVGAKGGRLDLLLNTVYYLNRPIENIPWEYYKEFLPASERADGQKGKFASDVAIAIPLCLGDVVGEAGEFRVVGTTPE